MDDNYKILKEKFVTGHAGGSLLEIYAITFTPMFTLLFWEFFVWKFKQSLIIEILCFIIIPILSVTFVELGILCSIALMLIGLLSVRREVPRKSSQPDRPKFLTVYRSLGMLYTCLAILAVDFTIFPRRLAKVEDYGISLMDIGVGSFVFSQGLIVGKQGSSFELQNCIKRSIPLFALGLGRLFLVKSSNYQEHVSEYGVHCNFFFILSALGPTAAISDKIFGKNLILSGTVFIVVYQYLLSVLDLEVWINEASRGNFISSNREGLFSYLGYFSLFCYSRALGKTAFSKEFTLKKLAILNAVLLALYSCLDHLGFKTSRRLANSMYVLCSLCFNLGSILICWLIEKLYNLNENSPIILDAVNNNQLFTFLLANILTGLVNFSFNTLECSSIFSLIILFGYSLLISATVICLRQLNIRIKV